MIKKIIIGVLVLAVLVLCGWKLFFSESKVDDQLKDLNTTMEAYHIKLKLLILEPQ